MTQQIQNNVGGQRIMFGPFIDETDGISPLNFLTITPADVKLRKHSSVLFTSSGGPSNATHIGSGYYEFLLGSADTDTMGRLDLVVDMAGALPVWRYFEVLDNNYYFVSHQTNPGANYSTFFRNSNSASAVILDDITATTSFTNEIADSATVTTGTETNTFASTAVRDGVYHQVDNVGNVIDYFYEFDMGVGVNGNQCTIFGRYNGTGGDSINVEAWNWVTLNWDFQATIGNSGSDAEFQFTLNSQQTGQDGTGDDGKVRIRFDNPASTAQGEMFVDEIYITASTAGGGLSAQEIADAVRENLPETVYQDGVELSTTFGNPGSTPFINGTKINPVDNLADAVSLLNQLNLRELVLQPGSVITITNDVVGYFVTAFDSLITLQSVDITSGAFSGGSITGTYTDAGLPPVFNRCGITDLVGQEIRALECQFRADSGSTFTSATSNATVRLVDCVDATADDAQIPTLNVSGADARVLIAGYTGTIKIDAIAATGKVEVSGITGKIIIGDQCNAAAEFTISGVCELDDQRVSPNADTVIQLSRLDGVNVGAYEGNAVHVSSASGVPGTVFPVGTPSVPVDTLTDARTIADAFGWKKLVLTKDDSFTLSQAWSGFTLEGDANLAMNSQQVFGTRFIECDVSGIALCDGATDFIGCRLESLVGNGEFVDCTLATADALTITGEVQLRRCSLEDVGKATINANNLAVEIDITECTGNFALSNTAALTIVRVHGFRGVFEIDVSCDAATQIIIDGVCTLIDNRVSVTTPVTRDAQLDVQQTRDAMGLTDSAGGDSVDKKLDDIETATGNAATQASVDAVKADTAAILTNTDVAMSTRSTQTSVDAVKVDTAAILVNTDTTTSSRATQTSVDAIQADVDNLASQTSVDAVKADTGAILLNTDVATSTRSTQLSVDAVEVDTAAILTNTDVATSTRATQTSVDAVQSDVTAIKAKTDPMTVGANGVEADIRAIIGTLFTEGVAGLLAQNLSVYFGQEVTLKSVDDVAQEATTAAVKAVTDRFAFTAGDRVESSVEEYQGSAGLAGIQTDALETLRIGAVDTTLFTPRIFTDPTSGSSRMEFDTNIPDTASTDDDTFTGRRCVFVSGTTRYQLATIESNTTQNGRVRLVTGAYTRLPENGWEIIIL